MKNLKISFVIEWAAGGQSTIEATVSYNGNKVRKEQAADFQETVKNVLGGIIAGVGKAKDFKFTVKTPYKTEQPECHYLGENLTIEVTGDNPACAAMLKRKIETNFSAQCLAENMYDAGINAVETAITATKQVMESAGRLTSSVIILIKRIAGED